MTEAGVVWEGPDTLRALLRPVGAIRTHPRNPRRGDVELIARSLSDFGQLKPVIVHALDGEPTIFAGNHTYTEWPVRPRESGADRGGGGAQMTSEEPTQ